MKNNIKNNMLSLKALKEELEALKSKNTASQTVSTGSNGSKNVTTRFTLRSGMLPLWLFTTLLSYGHKIPIISKIIKFLSLWYGRTTWWKLLIRARKIFVILNALIGVYTVFKVSGFSPDNLYAGFVGMGGTYLELLTNTVKRLFYWFVELFDHKIVPKPPDDPNIFKRLDPWHMRKVWGNGDTSTLTNKFMDLPRSAEFFNPQVKTSSSWLPDWNLTSILWWGTVTVVSVGVLYFGYKIVSDGTLTEWISTFNKSTDKGKGPSVDDAANAANSADTASDTASDIDIKDARTGVAGVFFTVINNTFKKVTNIFNPHSYYVPENERVAAYNSFMSIQNDMVRADHRYYPFTEVNPYATPWEKLSLYLFNESETAKAARELVRKAATSEATNVYNAGKDSLNLPQIPSAPGPSDPVGLNLGRDLQNSGPWSDGWQPLKTIKKLSGISPLPDSDEWANHVKDPVITPPDSPTALEAARKLKDVITPPDSPIDYTKQVRALHDFDPTAKPDNVDLPSRVTSPIEEEALKWLDSHNGKHK